MNGDNRVVELYSRRAKRYDLTTAVLYGLLGMRLNRHRRMAVDALRLSPGDTVVELGCGTGANFARLEEKVGPTGRVVGVDLTPAMLAEARKRVLARGWTNVDLVQSPMEAFRFPQPVGGVLSTFALTMCPEYDRLIREGTVALRPGGRLVVMCFRLPSNWLRRYPRLLVWLVKPYGGALEMADRHPWESMQRYLSGVVTRSFWFGMAYIAQGAKSDLGNQAGVPRPVAEPAT